MAMAIRFWIRTVGWALVLAAAFTLLSFLGGGGAAAGASFPGWLALGLALGAYPAGVSVSALVVGDDGLSPRRVATMAGAAVLVSVVFLVLAGFVGPALLGGAAERGEIYESRAMNLMELRSAIAAEAAEVDPAGTLEPTTIQDWMPVNHLLWELWVRLSGAVLPFLFAWIGIAAAYWVGRTPEAALRLPQLLGLGLVLVVATYLANENSYEWIVVQAAGPVPFAGLFSLIVPSLLAVGLCWPLALVKWEQGIKS